MFETAHPPPDRAAAGDEVVVRSHIDTLTRNLGYLVVIGLAIAYLPLLYRTLWVDEAGTFWMARGGPITAIAKTWHWPGQSLLYAAITSLFCFDGFPLRDFLLRVPSILGAAAACYFLFRLANDLYGQGAGKISAALFVFHPATIEYATQARPYALATAAVVASFWTIFRWKTNRDRRWLAGWVLSSTLIIYLHYMFVIVLAVQAAFVIAELRHRDRLQYVCHWLAAVAAVGLLATPILPHLALLGREAHTLPFTGKPNSWELSGMLAPSLFLCGLIASAALVHFRGEYDSKFRKVPSAHVLAIVGWWTAGPLLFFAISRLTNLQLFVPRYMSYSSSALVLLLTWVGMAGFGPRAGLVWAVLGMLATTANPLNLLSARQPGPEELGPVMRLIQAAPVDSNGQRPPVLFRSELPESDFYNWRDGNSSGSYLYTPFAAYPMKNRLLPLPYRWNDEVKAHIESLLATDLKNASSVLFVTHDPLWIPWVGEQFEHVGFTYRWVQPNNFFVVLFQRAVTPGTPRKSVIKAPVLWLTTQSPTGMS